MRTIRCGEQAFTLMETIMVLVLLGILAAVAAPKYFDYQESADAKAALASVAQAQARINAKFGEELLEGKSCAQALKAVSNLSSVADDGVDKFGEFHLSPADLSWETIAVSYSRDGSTGYVPSGADILMPRCDGSASLSGMQGVVHSFWYASTATDSKLNASNDWARKVMRSNNPDSADGLYTLQEGTYELSVPALGGNRLGVMLYRNGILISDDAVASISKHHAAGGGKLAGDSGELSLSPTEKIQITVGPGETIQAGFTFIGSTDLTDRNTNAASRESATKALQDAMASMEIKKVR